MNGTELNYTRLNVAGINRSTVNTSFSGEARWDGETIVIPNCWTLEDGTGAWLWEDGSPMLLENLPLLRKRVKNK